MTDELSPLELDWQKAMRLYDQWAREATNHNGYDRAGSRRLASDLRDQLEELVDAYGWQGTRVDPMVPWMRRRSLPFTPPQVDA